MKKLLSILLTVALLMGLAGVSSMADGEPTFQVSSAEAEPGEEVSLTVSLVNSPCVASVELAVDYDASVLEWTGVQEGEYGGTYDLAVGQLLTWFAADPRSGETKDGVFCTLTFKVLEGAASGQTPVTITYEEDSVYNPNEDNEFFLVSPGSVEVKNASSSHTDGLPYTDVPDDYPYYDEIEDMYVSGLMTGMTATTFEPETTLNRAFMAAVLYRRAGYPKQVYRPVFPDVKADDWFADCVLWAQASGNILGYNEGTFGPTDFLTREQLCTILWRYAVTTDNSDNSARASLDSFPDSARITEFALDAVSWCVATGIFEDRNGRLDAWQPATRAELAVMMSRYLKVVGK
ncbi:MAG: S-layer homology domain-containing protein [Lachnospiraceae bacterium]|nr:S-layer homology domain-containing protein [Lachnospiraceae bacterium]